MRWGMRGRGLFSSTTLQGGALFAIDGPYVSHALLSLLKGPLFAVDGPYVYIGRHSCLRSESERASHYHTRVNC